MKVNKKKVMGISIALGVMMFTTTAFAEITSSNGYEQLKDALKQSAENCSSKFDSFTFTTSLAIKDGGELLSEENGNSKYDNKEDSFESNGTQTYGNKKYEYYSYRDNKGLISYNSTEGVYYQTKYTDEMKDNILFVNPFKESKSSDIEKIVDALVGNLKDYAVVNQKSDGSKEISGSISEAQIPAFVNAVVSYAVKNEFSNQYQNEQYRFPKVDDDIYVKKIDVNVTVGKDGVIQSVIGTGTISGKDEKGKVHELTIELLGKLTDINSTSVKKPDLTGKNVETSTEDNSNQERLRNPEMYLGTYKSDIVIEKDNKFQKIGERIVDITQIDKKWITGRYHEEFNTGYEEYSKSGIDLNFHTCFSDKNFNTAEFQSTDTKGKIKSGSIIINRGMSNIYFSIDDSNIKYNNNDFNRVFN